jgi:uncharacterized protein
VGDRKLTLTVLDETFGICRLEGNAPVPAGLLDLEFCFITRPPQGLSIVAPEEALQRGYLPEEARIEGGWSCLRVEGPLDFSLVGVLAALAAPLARAVISVFALSTYDTDYLLAGNGQLSRARAALSEAGHYVLDRGPRP